MLVGAYAIPIQVIFFAMRVVVEPELPWILF